MSLREKSRHQRKGISKARSILHKYDSRKMAAVVHHIHFERHHGYESAKRGDDSQRLEPATE